MSGGLVCHDVRHDPACNDFRINIGSIPAQSDRERPTLCACRIDHVKSRIERLSLSVEITGLDALGDACWIDLDAQDCSIGHHASKRLRAAHTAKPCGEHETASQVAAEMPLCNPHENFVGPLNHTL